MTRNLRVIALIGSLLLLVAACGGGGDEPQYGPVTGGGIGGTGKGTVTSYGSIYVNGDASDPGRHYEVTDDTVITLDGVPVEQPDLVAKGTGLVARFILDGDANSDLTEGTALEVQVGHRVIGPVTGTDPLEVLGQKVVVIDGITEMAPLGLNAADLMLDDVVEVSGYGNPGDVIRATRLEVPPVDPPTWKLVGYVNAAYAGGSNLPIGNLTVDISAVTPTNCEGGPVARDLVQVELAASLPLSNPVTGVVSLACVSSGLLVPPGLGGTQVKADLTGLVGDVIDDPPYQNRPMFMVDGQAVETTNKTVYLKGDVSDIVEGAHVEVQGWLDTLSGIVTAKKVRFFQVRVRIRGPGPDKPSKTGQFMIMGISVQGNELTHDAAGVLDPLSGYTQQQLFVHGYVYPAAGNVVTAVTIQPQGMPDPDAVLLRGPVTNDPGVPPLFDILGVTIDTTNTGLFFLAKGGRISQQAFFDALDVDDQVSAETGTYDDLTGTILDPFRISFED